MATKSDNENIIKRVYHSIKESVITYEFPPGERLNIEVLADDLRVSTTPVRESLNRLVAEDLILMAPRVGFFMKSLLESEIRDLYELNHVLLDWSVVSIAKNYFGDPWRACPELSSFVDKVKQSEPLTHSQLVKFSGKLFGHLARLSGNSEINLRVQNINDRLHYIRICECEMQKDPVSQVLPLFELYCDCRFDELKDALSVYHENRLNLLPNIIRAKNFDARMMLEGYGA